MFKKVNLILLFISVSTTVAFIYFIITATENYDDTDLYVLEECEPYSEFNLLKEIKNIDSSEIVKKFPYKKYIEESGYCDVNNISNHIMILDSNYNNHWDISMNTLLVALTDSLKEYKSEELSKFNPQFLINKIEWAKKMKRYGDCYPNNKFLFYVTYEFWMSQISSLMYKYNGDNSKLRYDFRYKYLVTCLSMEKYFVSFGFSKKEKMINYLTEGRYMYIWNRIYKSTSLLTKLTLVFLIFLTIFTFIFSFKKIFLNSKK